MAVLFVPSIASRFSIRLLYPLLVLFSFWAASMSHIRAYLHSVLVQGNFDAAIGLLYSQLFINPVRLVGTTGLIWNERLLGRIERLPELSSAALVSFSIWEVVGLDFLFGSTFWFLVSNIIIRISENRHRLKGCSQS